LAQNPNVANGFRSDKRRHIATGSLPLFVAPVFWCDFAKKSASKMRIVINFEIKYCSND
jgi:hypothetical protein